MSRPTGVAARVASKKRVDSDPSILTKDPVLTTRTTRLAARSQAKFTASKSQSEQVTSSSETGGSSKTLPQPPTVQSTAADEHKDLFPLPASEASHAEVEDVQPRKLPITSLENNWRDPQKPSWMSSDDESDVDSVKTRGPELNNIENEEHKRVMAKFHKEKFVHKYGHVDLQKYRRMYDDIDAPKIYTSPKSDADSQSEAEDEQVEQSMDESEAESEEEEQSKVEYESQTEIGDETDSDSEPDPDAEPEPDSDLEIAPGSDDEDQSQDESDDEEQSESKSEIEIAERWNVDESEEESDDEDERNNVGGIIPPAKDLTEEMIAQHKADGHFRWGEAGYDYYKDSLFYGNVWPFPREKEICKLIASYLIPEHRVVKIKAVNFHDITSATFDDDYSPEDKKEVSDLTSALLSWRSMYKCIGGMAFSLFQFEFNKTPALIGLLTYYREWESTNGLPSVLCNVKTITINNSFGQKFGDWLADMSNMECIDEEGKIKELDGLKEIIFTGMPSGRSVEDAGTCYMPSSLEKLRALAGKLKKREMQTYVVKKGGLEQERVDVRLICNRDFDDDDYGVKEDELLLDPSEEMKAYRHALSRNNANKQQKASRRLSAGLASHSPQKGKGKKRGNSSGSHQTKKSPKKDDGSVRWRRTSDEYEAEDLNRRISDVSLEEATEADDKTKAERRIFTTSALEGFMQQMKGKSQEDKDLYKASLHFMLDEQLKKY